MATVARRDKWKQSWASINSDFSSGIHQMWWSLLPNYVWPGERLGRNARHVGSTGERQRWNTCHLQGCKSVNVTECSKVKRVSCQQCKIYTLLYQRHTLSCDLCAGIYYCSKQDYEAVNSLSCNYGQKLQARHDGVVVVVIVIASIVKHFEFSTPSSSRQKIKWPHQSTGMWVYSSI